MPSFLTPDFGLLFWMLIAFLVVLFILGKFGFPVIIKMVNERKEFIDESLKNAREANEKLANIRVQGEEILKEAKTQQTQIINDAKATRERMLREAKDKASAEAARIVEDARLQIEAEREKARRDAREQVADLSVKIAGKVISKELSTDKEQLAWIDNLLNELSVSK